MKLNQILQKWVSERTIYENEQLIKAIQQMPFAKSRKFKERDCKEFILGLKRIEFEREQEILAFGSECRSVHVVILGKVAVWQPVLHQKIKPVLEEFLDKIESSAQLNNFFSHLHLKQESEEILQKERKLDTAQRIDQAKIVVSEVLESISQIHSYDDDVAGFQKQIKIDHNRVHLFWDQYHKYMSHGQAHQFPNHKIEFQNRSFQFIHGQYFEKVLIYQYNEMFGEPQKDNKMRSYIKAETDAEICTIDHDFFKKAIQKVEQKRLNKYIEFMMNLKCFQNNSKNAVIKFYYYLDKVKFTRNKSVYVEGQPANFVYIVWKGEFEIQAKVPKKVDPGIDRINSVIGINQNKKPAFNFFEKKLPEIQDIPNTHRLSIYGPGCLLGEEDVLSQSSVYRCNVRCYSTKGVVFIISKDKFMTLMAHEKTLELVKNIVNHKTQHKEGKDLPPAIVSPKAKIAIDANCLSNMQPENYLLQEQKKRLKNKRNLQPDTLSRLKIEPATTPNRFLQRNPSAVSTIEVAFSPTSDQLKQKRRNSQTKTLNTIKSYATFLPKIIVQKTEQKVEEIQKIVYKSELDIKPKITNREGCPSVRLIQQFGQIMRSINQD